MSDREPTLDPALARELIDAMNAMRAETVAVRERAEELVPAAEAEVKRAREMAEVERARARTTRILLGALSAVVVVVVVLGAVLWSVVNRQDRTTQEALCPVFGLLLGGYSPESRPVGVERDIYNQTFVIFGEAYAALSCDSPIVPPAIRR